MKNSKSNNTLTKVTVLAMALTLFIGLIPNALATESTSPPKTIPFDSTESNPEVVETVFEETQEATTTILPESIEINATAPVVNTSNADAVASLQEAAAAYVEKWHLNDGMTDENMANLYFTFDSEESWDAWSTLDKLKEQVLLLSAEEQRELFQDPNALLCWRFYDVMAQINMPMTIAGSTTGSLASGLTLKTSPTVFTWTLAADSISVTAAPKSTTSGTGCNQTTSYSSQTDYIELTVASGMNLSVTVEIGGTGSVAINDTEISNGHKATFTNQTVKISVTSGSSEGDSLTLKVGYTYTAADAKVNLTFQPVPGIPYKVNGTAVTDTAQTVTGDPAEGFTVTADSANYVLDGASLVDESGSKHELASVSGKLLPTVNGTVTPSFGYDADADGNHPYLVDGSYFWDWDKAMAAASGGGKLVVLVDDQTLLPRYETDGKTVKPYTVPSNVSFLIPYASGKHTISTGTNVDTSGDRNSTWIHANNAFTSDEYDNGTNNDSSVTGVLEPDADVYLELTIPKNVTVNVSSDAKLVIGGTIVSGTTQTGGVCGATAGAHSNLIVDGTLNINTDAILSTCGYVLGSGAVNIVGGSAYQPFVLMDYHDGHYTANSTKNGNFPAYRYIMPNIQAPFTITSGGKLLGYIDVYTQSSFGIIAARHNVDCKTIVGNSSDGLICLSDGATFSATYDPDDYVTTTSNQSGSAYYKKAGKTHLTLSKGATLGNLTITIPVPVVGDQSSSSSSTDFPMPYHFDITLEDGTYTLPYNLVLYPGASMYVKSGADLVVSGGKFVALDGLRDYSSRKNPITIGTWYEYHYPSTTNFQSAGYNGSSSLIVDGTMTVKSGASFGGYVQTNGGGKIIMEGTPSATIGVGNVKCYGSVVNKYVGRTEHSLKGWLYAYGSDGTLQVTEMVTGGTYYGIKNETGYTIPSYAYRVYTTADDTSVYTDVTDEKLNAKIVGSWCKHNWSTDWKSDGTNHWKECANCGSKKDQAAHTSETVTGYLPTYSTKGKTDGAKCSVCSKVLTAQIDIPKVVQLAAFAASAAEEIILDLKVNVPDTVTKLTVEQKCLEKQELITETKTYTINVSEKTVTPDDSSDTSVPYFDETTGRLIVSRGVASGEMTQPVTLTFYNGTEIVKVRPSGLTKVSELNKLENSLTRTVVDYAKLVQDKGSPEQKALIQALVTYGGYAQILFNVDSTNPAYSILGTEAPDLSAVTIPSMNTDTSLSDTLTPSGTISGLTIAEKNQAYLDSAIYFRVYFTITEGSVDDYTVSYNVPVNNKDGKTVILTPQPEVDRYYVDIPDIPSGYLDYPYSITFQKGSETVTLKASVLANLKRILESEKQEEGATPAQLNMAKAMYLYNQAANTYFGK